eukprot:5090096-Prorocentrum_lima.AAC.1
MWPAGWMVAVHVGEARRPGPSQVARFSEDAHRQPEDSPEVHDTTIDEEADEDVCSAGALLCPR